MQLGLLSWALWRRPEYITIAIALAFMAGLGVAEFWPKETRLPIIVMLDALLVAAMRWLAFRYDSDRARIVATIGACKIGFVLIAALVDLHAHSRAAVINTAFMVQVIVAGGLGNGVLAWVGHRWHGLSAGLRRIVGTVGA